MRRLEQALEALHVLFKDADTLGSLIDPRRAVETSAGEQVSFESVEWDEISALLEKALAREAADPATAVLGADAAGIARAAELLSRDATRSSRRMCRTSVAGKQVATLVDVHADAAIPMRRADLATAFVDRVLELVSSRRTCALRQPAELAIPSVATRASESRSSSEAACACSLGSAPELSSRSAARLSTRLSDRRVATSPRRASDRSIDCLRRTRRSIEKATRLTARLSTSRRSARSQLEHV